MNGRAKFRLFLLFVLAGVFGVLAFLVLRERDPMPPYLEAMKAYAEEGAALEQQGKNGDAAAKYGEACVLLEIAYKRLDVARNLDPEKVKQLAGKILYLKAKALRDKHFAQAAATGKPLPETTDSVTGESFRSWTAIPDPVERTEASGSLLGAALRFLPSDFEVQRDALRFALMSTPIPWLQIDKLSSAILTIQPADSRAKFLLARIDFEQPESNGVAKKLDKRSRERMRRAQELLADVRKDPSFPIWRTEHLDASIHYWLMKNSGKDAADEELAILNRMLHDADTGVLARLRRGVGLTRLGAWDAEGIVGLYGMSFDVALQEVRKSKGKALEVRKSKGKALEVRKSKGKALDEGGEAVGSKRLEQTLNETLTFCRTKVDGNDPAFPPSLVANAVTGMMVKGQSHLALQHREQWQAGLDFLRLLFAAEFKADRCEPLRVAQFAELLMRQAYLESPSPRGENPKQAAPLQNEARTWLRKGFEFGQRHKFDGEQMLPFNLLAANVGFLSGDPRAALAPYLADLKKTRLPLALATALLIDGSFDEREGKLQMARDKIEQAVKIANGDEELRGNAALANIYMALGRPDYALVNLIKLQKKFDYYDDLTDSEKEWLAVFLRTPKHYHALTVVASLESARRKIAAHTRKNPTEPYPAELVKEEEDRVEAILAKELSTAIGEPGFAARVAWIRHLALTNRRADAGKLWEAFNRDFPDTIEMLDLKIVFLERDALASEDPRKRQEFVADVDRITKEFIAKHPKNRAAPLRYATWLAQTGRPEQALVQLRAIVDAAPATPEVRRAAMAIMMTLDSDTSPMAIARHLPRNPQIDNALLDIGRHSAQARDDFRKALALDDSAGLSRVLQAGELLASGSHAHAAEAFVAAFEFTRLKAFAEQGLLRSIVELADRDPQSAQELVDRICDKLPDEPIVWLATAYVELARDAIGAPADDWDFHRTMSSALNVWEAKQLAVRDAVVPIALTRAEFWLKANRVDLALADAKRALAHAPQNPGLLQVCIKIMLDDPDRGTRPELAGYLERLHSLAPDSLVAKRLQGRAYERERRWEDAAKLFEDVVGSAKKDRETYARLINVLEQIGNKSRTQKWIDAWRRELPNDSQAVAAEIRFLSRTDGTAQAIRVADAFLEHAQTVSQQATDQMTNAAARSKLVADTRCLLQIELARGFLLGGAAQEAERRLGELPASFAETSLVQELFVEIALRKKDWSKAEALLQSILSKNPGNLAAVNNLAYLNAVHNKDAARAREIILASIKAGSNPISLRAADRVPAEFLNTFGLVYSALAEPKFVAEMLQFYSAVAARFPSDPRIELYSGYAYELSGDDIRARDSFDRAIAKASHPAFSPDQRETVLAKARAHRDRVEIKIKAATP